MTTCPPVVGFKSTLGKVLPSVHGSMNDACAPLLAARVPEQGSEDAGPVHRQQGAPSPQGEHSSVARWDPEERMQLEKNQLICFHETQRMALMWHRKTGKGRVLACSICWSGLPRCQRRQISQGPALAVAAYPDLISALCRH